MTWLANSIIVTDNTVETLLAGYDSERFYLRVTSKQTDISQTVILNRREGKTVYLELANFLKERR